MSHTADIIRGTIVLIVAVVLLGWVLIRSLKRSEDPPLLIFKWILTGLTLLVLLWKVAPMIWTSGAAGAYIGIPLVAVCGVVLAIIWRRSLISIIANPVGSMFDGGDREIEPRPAYSIAQAKRNRGHYSEAIAEVRKQLAKFPTDLEGQLLLAQLQAEHMNDLQGAEITIQRLCNQPAQTPRNLALALNTLADWHLKLAQDRDAARQDLEKIIALLPDSELSALAAQRIAHLADTAFLLEPYDRRAIHVSPGIQDIGLLPGEQQPAAPETRPEAAAEAYVKHLEEHPLDTEAREKLAVIYAEHYRRLDLAADQLEQLIGHPIQPAKRIVHWLNLLADLQIRHGGDYEQVRHTVQRIIDLYPGTAAAHIARNRLEFLKLELKGREQSRTVKLGSYEQDIGLKRGLPHQP
jgi:tetratricopeptide (TPR) repeat protein